MLLVIFFFFFQAEDGIRDVAVTGVQTCALPILERVYELDGIGFRRLEPALPRVVVYGGDGFFGHLVGEDLLKYSSAEIIIASRHPKATNFHAFEKRGHKGESDINDYASLLSTIECAEV